jgi:hypothetical protein
VVADVLLDLARRDGDALRPLPLWLRMLRWAPLGRLGRAGGVDRVGRDRRPHEHRGEPQLAVAGVVRHAALRQLPLELGHRHRAAVGPQPA